MIQFVDQSAGNDGIERRAEVNKQHIDKSFGAFQVVESSVEGDVNGVNCGSVGPVGKLMSVEARWDVGFSVLQDQSLHALRGHQYQGHRLVIIQPCDGGGFGFGDYASSFQGNGTLACWRE